MIKEIFQSAGYAADELDPAIKVELCYIANPDQSPRWIWPARLTKPCFLRFYNTGSHRALLYSLFIQCIFFLRLQRWFFTRLTLWLTPDKNTRPAFDLQKNWALFTGTPGPCRKALVYISGENGGQFLKIALGEDAPRLLQNEKKALQYLHYLKPRSYTCPEVDSEGNNSLTLCDIRPEKAQRATRISTAHMNVWREMSLIKPAHIAAARWKPLLNVRDLLDKLSTANDDRLPKGMIRKLQWIASEIPPSKYIHTAFSHGDFTPWNMYIAGDKIALYDWELCAEARPAGYDAFHFIIQQGILVARKCWKDIYADMQRELSGVFDPYNGLFPTADMDDYLSYYLLLHITYYLDIYHRQNAWHIQVQWLLNTWNEALSQVLSKRRSHRSLMAMDVFDLLQNKPAAALKFKCIYPEEISEDTDIDICLKKQEAKLLHSYVKNHVLTAKTQSYYRSFMSHITILMKDGELLSIDSIWILKRKATIMLDAAVLLQNSHLDQWGIRRTRFTDELKYIGLFYALNDAPVPDRYKAFASCLSHNDDELQDHLYLYFKGYKPALAPIKYLVSVQPFNKGWKAVINHLSYAADSLLGLCTSRALVITFSGVDGAGKSTIIALLAHCLEKKHRKKVKLLRHRPSLLPILSSYRHGRATAEALAASSLPRQGKNQKLLPSLLRFGYYYADYILGQFYVYFRYTLRGTTVIYDRYYFDFINDSRRSNIALPERLTRWAYCLLMKPDINLFLYASPEEILRRKKELDAATINLLTDKYKKLFDELAKETHSARYLVIENLKMENTLQLIQQLFIAKSF